MNKYLVEFLGTAFLTFIVLAIDNYLVVGAATSLALYLGGSISGGPFNPAVTIAMLMDGRIERNDLLPYIIAQIFGAVIGLYLVQNFVN